MPLPKFTKDFGAPDQMPPAAIERVNQLLSSGRLFRYQHESNDDVELLEGEFAQYIGSRYCVCVSSGGAALFLSLYALRLKLGLPEGAPVLVSAFTLTPVPSSVVHAGLKPVFVECGGEDLALDVEDLRKRARETGAKVLLLSYMRGRVPQMDVVLAAASELNLTIVEDCAHTLGSTRGGKHFGTFGATGCFSFQTNKAINAGEGGAIVTDDPEIAGRTVLLSGSYGYFSRNGTKLPVEQVAKMYPSTPNFSSRMTNLAAALVRPQLLGLDEKVRSWNQHYAVLASGLRQHCPEIFIPVEQADVVPARSSAQFSIPSMDARATEALTRELGARGVKVAWFGRPEWLGFTSTVRHWEYAGKQDAALPETVSRQAGLLDLPLYHTNLWSDDDFRLLAAHVGEAVRLVQGSSAKL